MSQPNANVSNKILSEKMDAIITGQHELTVEVRERLAILETQFATSKDLYKHRLDEIEERQFKSENLVSWLARTVFGAIILTVLGMIGLRP